MTRDSLQEGLDLMRLIEEYEETIRNLRIPETCKATLFIDGTDEDGNNIEQSIRVPVDSEADIIRTLRAKYNELLKNAKAKFASL